MKHVIRGRCIDGSSLHGVLIDPYRDYSGIGSSSGSHSDGPES